MTDSTDAYWDELGIAWRAASSDLTMAVPRIERWLRWQAACARGLMIVGVPISIAGLVLGAVTIWIGSAGAWNFITRGIGIIAISMLMAFGVWSLRVGVRAATRSLAEMIDLALLRAERTRTVVLAGYWACGIAAAFGLIGYAIRVRIGRPPAMSPIEPLVLLAVTSVGLYLYHRRVRDDLAKFRYLKGLLAQSA